MGQTIEINRASLIGDTAVIDTDRSLAGQDGQGFEREAAHNDPGFPAQLAARLFEHDADIEHVFVMSNTVTARRRGGWADDALARATGVVSSFFRFYTDAAEAEESSDEEE